MSRHAKENPKISYEAIAHIDFLNRTHGRFQIILANIQFWPVAIISFQAGNKRNRGKLNIKRKHNELKWMQNRWTKQNAFAYGDLVAHIVLCWAGMCSVLFCSAVSVCVCRCVFMFICRVFLKLFGRFPFICMDRLILQ